MNKKIKEQLLAIKGKKVGRFCPKCGAVMVVRQNTNDGNFFLGCHRYPDCHGSMNIDESFIMHLQRYKEFWEV